MSDAKPLMAGNKAHPSYIKRLAALAALAATPLGAQVTPRQPPAAPVRPVTDTYFGAAVVDPYRWMEASDNATELREWMLAQNHYTRSMLERIPGRDSLLARLNRDAHAVPFVGVDERRGNRYFVLRAEPNEEFVKYYVRNGIHGNDRLVLDPSAYTLASSSSNRRASRIVRCVPSPSGRKVACELASGGSEDATLFVLSVETRHSLVAPIRRAFRPTWLPDESGFVYSRLPELPPGTPPAARNQNGRVYLHRFGSEIVSDRPLFGSGVWPGIAVDPAHYVSVRIPLGSTQAFAADNNGTAENDESWTAPVAALVAKAPIPWRRIIRAEDEVTDYAVHGDALFLLSYHGASGKRLLRTSFKMPDPATAQVVVPESDRVIAEMKRTSAAIYLLSTEGGESRLLRVPLDGTSPTPVPLPFPGTVHGFEATNEATAELGYYMSGWTHDVADYRYDPIANRLDTLDVQPTNPYSAMNDVVSSEVMVRAGDGTMIPLSIVHRRGVVRDGSAPTILEGYGAYGVSLTPHFLGVLKTWFDNGGVYAVAHVRGGGEFGERWHAAGRGPTKPNSWRDFLACAEYLVQQRYTSPAHLAAKGASAGGILVGRAITERPDLFRAAIIEVGLTNPLRSETTANGVANIPEFGSTKLLAGFRALYEMDAYQHVVNGAAYPAVLLTTGLNDPRVDPWQVAKMAARLQAATSGGRPILLRVDAEGGHSGSTASANITAIADEQAFLFWQLGNPAFHVRDRANQQ